ncbi:type II toxin-antitoxin system RelE/ParE family toxin [Komagataeibacter europaeus]|uniref:type II toxin-antitoxin system RelE/ParE family toxin n=1 Tax=Komagataeibacter europaeus TaxID=33995 RepID=UPI002156CF8A|nr:type II toxin-antitoxin system RelE/ParE family toxin [Komagataeibacter europaeus]GBQ41151.1 hypothetical protein AA18890_1040 [Komagataeibacter europaeus LMG 18890]
MSFNVNDLSKDLRAFWNSNGQNTSKINANYAKRLRLALTHLYYARTQGDIAFPAPKDWRFHKLQGHENRYSIDVTGNARLHFDIVDADNGVVADITFFDPH